jgi:hypothetical protein
MRTALFTVVTLAFMSQAGAASLPEALRHFPPGADVLVGIEAKEILNAPLVKALRAKGEIHIESADLKRAQEILGFDPLKDVERLTLGLAVTDDEEMPVKDWLLVLRGDFAGFQLDALAGLLEKEAGPEAAKLKTRTEKIHGQEVRLIRVPDKKVPMDIGFVRPSTNTLVLGSREYLRSYLSARAGKTRALSPATGLGKIASRIPKDASFWVAANPEHFAGHFDKKRSRHGHLKKFPQIENLLVSGRLDKDLYLTAIAQTADKETARNLGDACRGLLALARLLPHDEPKLTELVDRTSLNTSDREVTLKATLPGKWIESR